MKKTKFLVFAIMILIVASSSFMVSAYQKNTDEIQYTNSHAIEALKVCLEIDEAPNFIFDEDLDGKVTLGDVLIILKKALGVIEEPPATQTPDNNSANMSNDNYYENLLEESIEEENIVTSAQVLNITEGKDNEKQILCSNDVIIIITSDIVLEKDKETIGVEEIKEGMRITFDYKVITPSMPGYTVGTSKIIIHKNFT